MGKDLTSITKTIIVEAPPEQRLADLKNRYGQKQQPQKPTPQNPRLAAMQQQYSGEPEEQPQSRYPDQNQPKRPLLVDKNGKNVQVGDYVAVGGKYLGKVRDITTPDNDGIMVQFFSEDGKKIGDEQKIPYNKVNTLQVTNANWYNTPKFGKKVVFKDKNGNDINIGDTINNGKKDYTVLRVDPKDSETLIVKNDKGEEITATKDVLEQKAIIVKKAPDQDASNQDDEDSSNQDSSNQDGQQAAENSASAHIVLVDKNGVKKAVSPTEITNTREEQTNISANNSRFLAEYIEQIKKFGPKGYFPLMSLVGTKPEDAIKRLNSFTLITGYKTEGEPYENQGLEQVKLVKAEQFPNQGKKTPYFDMNNKPILIADTVMYQKDVYRVVDVAPDNAGGNTGGSEPVSPEQANVSPNNGKSAPDKFFDEQFTDQGKKTPYVDMKNRPIFIGNTVMYYKNKEEPGIYRVYSTVKDGGIVLVNKDNTKVVLSSSDIPQKIEVIRITQEKNKDSAPDNAADKGNTGQTPNQTQGQQPDREFSMSGYENIQSGGADAGPVKFGKDGRPTNPMGKVAREMYIVMKPKPNWRGKDIPKYYLIAGRSKKDGTFLKTSETEMSKDDALQYVQQLSQMT